MSGPMGLEFQVVVSHCVSSGDQTQILCKNSKCSYPLSLSPALNFFSFFLTMLFRLAYKVKGFIMPSSYKYHRTDQAGLRLEGVLVCLFPKCWEYRLLCTM